MLYSSYGDVAVAAGDSLSSIHRGQNRYSYAYNNPMTFTDHDGHAPSRNGYFLNKIVPTLFTVSAGATFYDISSLANVMLIGHSIYDKYETIVAKSEAASAKQRNNKGTSD